MKFRQSDFINRNIFKPLEIKGRRWYKIPVVILQCGGMVGMMIIRHNLS